MVIIADESWRPQPTNCHRFHVQNFASRTVTNFVESIYFDLVFSLRKSFKKSLCKVTCYVHFVIRQCIKSSVFYPVAQQLLFMARRRQSLPGDVN